MAVELFVGEIGDQAMVFHAQHSYYRALLEAGVRIWLYPGPSILHAKHLSVDELVTVVGSSNMDIRSFALDLELSLLTCGRAFADEMRAVEDEYRPKGVLNVSPARPAIRCGTLLTSSSPIGAQVRMRRNSMNRIPLFNHRRDVSTDTLGCQD